MSAYRVLGWSGAMADQQKVVLNLWRAPGRNPATLWTRAEIERETGLKINAVCGRVNELVKEPFALLVERGKKECSVTRNEVNAIGLAKEEDPR